MPLHRAAVLAAVLGTGAALLTACEAPKPGVTFWSGTSSVSNEALCWAFDSNALEPGECAEEIVSGAGTGDSAGNVGSLRVVSGNVLGISVDPEVADTGWTVRIGGQALVNTPITETYWRFTFPQVEQVPEEGFVMQVVAGQGTDVRGIWATRLTATN